MRVPWGLRGLKAVRSASGAVVEIVFDDGLELGGGSAPQAPRQRWWSATAMGARVPASAQVRAALPRKVHR